MALPPPIETKTSPFCSRANATPWRMNSMVGSEGTAKRGPSSRLAKRSADWPVTTRARRPREAAASATSCAVPSPNRMREAVEKSNGIALPALIGGEDVLVGDARARLGQHVGDGGGPGEGGGGVVWVHREARDSGEPLR